MFWLWAVTAFGAGTSVATSVGWALTYYRLDKARWALVQAERAAQHVQSFHRCPEHANTALFNAPEHWERVRDLNEIGRRNRDLYQNRSD